MKYKIIAVASAFIVGNLLINPAEAGLSCSGGATLGSTNITDSTGPGGSACSVTSNGTTATNNASYALIKAAIGNAFNVGAYTGNTLTNAGDIGVAYSGSGTAINLSAGGELTTLTNSGNIGGGGTGISMGSGSSIGTLNNSGLFGSITYSGTTYSSVTAISLSGGSITTLNNTGSIIPSSSGTGIGLGGSSTITLLSNQASGVIGNSSTLYGVSNGLGSTITTLTNEGTITSSVAGAGIYNSGTITTLNNSQGTTALKYKGTLPTNYNLVIASATVFGKITFSNIVGTGTMAVGVGSGSTVANGTTYSSVISGITSSSKFTNTTGTYSGLSWYLSQQGTSGIWDLIFGTPPSSSSVDLTPNAYAMRSVYNLQAAALNAGLSYDCAVFDKEGLCLSTGGRYSTTNSPNATSTSGLLIGSYKYDKNIRLGAWVDQNLSTNSADGIKLGNSKPLLGVFGVWSERNDGLGYEVKVSAGYGEKDITVTRTADYQGSAKVNTKGLQSISSYGIALDADWIAAPYAGLKYVSISRGGYTEGGSSPLTYDTLRQETTSVVAGVKFTGKIDPQTSTVLSAGVEHDLNHNVGQYSAGSSNTTAFNSDVKKTRPVVTAGVYYDIDKTQRVGLNATHRQEAFQSTATTSALATYMVGF